MWVSFIFPMNTCDTTPAFHPEPGHKLFAGGPFSPLAASCKSVLLDWKKGRDTPRIGKISNGSLYLIVYFGYMYLYVYIYINFIKTDWTNLRDTLEAPEPCWIWLIVKLLPLPSPTCPLNASMVPPCFSSGVEQLGCPTKRSSEGPTQGPSLKTTAVPALTKP